MNNIIIDNLPETATETELQELFSAYGKVRSATIVRGISMRGRGLAFVGMDPAAARAAIKGLNGKKVQGKQICVAPARRDKAKAFAIQDVSPSW
ncbi:MAG: RNA-binding protein [Deltaproteobacteria bacterium]|nr:RNA-binding protein [Deltaproteobacteria bacterium]